jgi:hypothetical protein
LAEKRRITPNIKLPLLYSRSFARLLAGGTIRVRTFGSLRGNRLKIAGIFILGI